MPNSNIDDKNRDLRTAQDLLRQAEESLTAGKLEETRQRLLRAVKADPDNERTLRLALDVQMRISGVSDEVGAEEIEPDHLLPAFEEIRKEIPCEIDYDCEICCHPMMIRFAEGPDGHVEAEAHGLSE